VAQEASAYTPSSATCAGRGEGEGFEACEGVEVMSEGRALPMPPVSMLRKLLVDTVHPEADTPVKAAVGVPEQPNVVYTFIEKVTPPACVEIETEPAGLVVQTGTFPTAPTALIEAPPC